MLRIACHPVFGISILQARSEIMASAAQTDGLIHMDVGYERLDWNEDLAAGELEIDKYVIVVYRETDR
jgi:hypothetical protein